jgi:alpha-beta hydrolase superfamily lysophospholipase
MNHPAVNDLYTRIWHTPSSAPRGSLLIVHGLGEHCGRYDHVAAHYTALGYDVYGFDHFGHGQSPGARGAMLHELHYLENLGLIVDWVRSEQRHHRLIMLGHSMGGAVAARFVSVGMRPLEGLILSSPALDVGLNPTQRLLLAALAPWAGGLRIPNGLKVQGISRDPAVVKAYQADPLVHDKVAVRLVQFMFEHGPQTLARAGQWTVPTLLLYAGADMLVAPAGSRAFAQAANDKVQVHCFEELYHEILNEPEKEQVLERMDSWLKALSA